METAVFRCRGQQYRRIHRTCQRMLSANTLHHGRRLAKCHDRAHVWRSAPLVPPRAPKMAIMARLLAQLEVERNFREPPNPKSCIMPEVAYQNPSTSAKPPPPRNKSANLPKTGSEADDAAQGTSLVAVIYSFPLFPL